MKSELTNALESFESLILVKIDNSDDIYQSDFQYISGSFSVAGFKNFINFNQVIKSIYRSAPICEGIGYYEYCNDIKEAIYFCITEGKKASFILPLRKNGKNGQTYYFLMNISKVGDSINALFIHFDEKSGLYNIEDFSSGTFKDSLTGLFNYKTLVSHISENKRKGYLCLYDLNKFKEINDNFGHEIGDDVLIEIANYLISISSMNEVFYRRSGDEFVILIFEKSFNYTLKLINKIERFIESIPALLKKEFEVSAAFGVLELIENSVFNYETQSKLIDLAMYQAKKSHKLYHFISYADAIGIIDKGDLDERIDSIASSLKR